MAGPKNTMIRTTDLDNLNLANAIDTGKTTQWGDKLYRSSEVVDMIHVDQLQHGPGVHRLKYLG